MKSTTFIFTLILSLHAPLFAKETKKNSCVYKSEKPIQVGTTTDNWEPWSYFNSNGDLEGWDISYLKELMQVIGKPVINKDYFISTNKWGQGCCKVNNGVSSPPTLETSPYFSALLTNEVDLAISVTSDSERRKSLFNVSRSYGYLPSFVKFTIRKDKAHLFDFKHKKLDALQGKKIGVLAKGTNQDYYLGLLRNETNLNFDIVYGNDLVTNDGEPASALTRSLKSGEIDAIFAQALTGQLDFEAVSKGSVKELDDDRFKRTWGTGAAIFFGSNSDLDLIKSVNCAIEYIYVKKSELYKNLKLKFGKGLCSPLMSDSECESRLMKKNFD